MKTTMGFLCQASDLWTGARALFAEKARRDDACILRFGHLVVLTSCDQYA